jgi:hypothetical protein
VRAKGTRWYRVELERSHAQPPDGTRRYTCMVYSMRAPHGLRACTQLTQGSRGGPVAHVQVQAKEISARDHRPARPSGRPLMPVPLPSGFSITRRILSSIRCIPVHRMCKLLLLISLLHLAFIEFFFAYFDPFSCSHLSVLYFIFFSFPSKHQQQIAALSF